jgi:hypothetical protein
MARAKKFAKYSSGVYVNSELVKPRLQQPNTAYLNIEEELNALAKANKIRLAISGMMGGILTILILGYSMLAGSFGFFDISKGTFVTYPAFASESQIKGGFVQTVGTKVYASSTQAAPSNFFSKVQTGFTGAPNSVIATVESLDTSSYILIEDGKITILNGANSTLIEGTYSGSLEGQNKLTNQYVMKCVSGACKEGELILVSLDNIVGVVG